MTEESAPSYEGLDPDWANDFLSDLIITRGKTLFCLEWDSGGPGAGAGQESIFLFNKELFLSSMDFGVSGPHESVGRIIADNVRINGATVQVTFPAKQKAEIMAALQVDPENEGHLFLLNGAVWMIKDGRIMPES